MSRLRAWWAEHVRGSPAKQYPVSGYLTLIPLSGKPLRAGFATCNYCVKAVFLGYN